MNRKVCPKCGEFMIAWTSQGENQRPTAIRNVWRCACGHEEEHSPKLPTAEELFQKKWKRANNMP